MTFSQLQKSLYHCVVSVERYRGLVKSGEKPCACHVCGKKFCRIGGYSILIGGTAPGSGVWYQDGGTVPQFEVPGYHGA